MSKTIEDKCAKDKKYRKVRDHCHYTGEYRGAAHSIFNLKYGILKELALIFHNESYYDYHFIITELAKKLEGQYTCLGENNENYISLSVPFQKKKLQELVKMKKKLQKLYLTDYNLLIAQD